MVINIRPDKNVGLVVGIDATNLRQGGGRTHLIELLRAANPHDQGIERVLVWGSQATLALLEDRPWLEKISPSALEGGLLSRTRWQRFQLSNVARVSGCDVLFVPGGSYSGDFHPIVTMSRNMLPFEWPELRRYGWSVSTLKLLLLRLIQLRTFQSADGVIFLTHYANVVVEQVSGGLQGRTTIIPHGLNKRFVIPPRVQRPISEYSARLPFRILYVSIIDQYKHQWKVVEAVAALRQETGWPLMLELVGPGYTPALRYLKLRLRKYDPDGSWVRYHGHIPFTELHRMYAQAEIGVFASSCENMPNILLETMAAGLPIACSDRGPMPEILESAGVYFDPENAHEISRSLRKLIESPELRFNLATSSFGAAQKYTWRRCAEQTFGFLAEICQKHFVSKAACVG